MGFKKQNNILFEGIVPKASSVSNGMINIPLVFTKEKGSIHGFVPGFSIKDVIATNLQDCKKLLNLYVKEEVLKRIENQDSFPFFPSDDEIYNDFDNVIKIIRINYTIGSQTYFQE